MKNKHIKKAIPIISAVLAWGLAAHAIGEDLYLPSPVAVFYKLAEIVSSSDFIGIVLTSLSKIAFGFAIAVTAGFLLALFAVRFTFLEILFAPYMTILKSAPVVSFVLLCMLWASKDVLPIVIVFMINLPIVYTNLINGFKSADTALLQLAAVYKMNFIKKLKYIYLPAAKPQALAAAALSSGIAVKSCIAAEIIGLPLFSIGDAMHRAKLYLETGELFAWTVVILIISFAFEKLMLGAVKILYSGLES